MRSDKIKKGLERMPNRALLYGTGLSPSHMQRPFIGIASSFTDLIPGHTNMRDLERYIERGVENAQGTPFLFGVPGICDGIDFITSAIVASSLNAGIVTTRYLFFSVSKFVPE